MVLDSARSLRFWNYDSFGTGRISTYTCGLAIPDETQYFNAYLAVCLDRDNPAFVPFTEFEQMVASEAGESATNCGVAEVGSVLFDNNQCIVDAFILQNPAYAIYKLQGIDSLLAEAITISESGVVRLWFYDSNISGGGELTLSLVDNVECELPEVNSDLEVPLSELFTCI